jgi:hypothetical protein
MTKIILWLYLHTWRKLLSLIFTAYYEIFWQAEKSRAIELMKLHLTIIESPDFLGKWITARLDYESDPIGGIIDVDRPWWVVLMRRKDDCDGWAELFKVFAKAKGWEAYRVFTWASSLSESHCVCAIKWGIFWYYFDTSGYHEVPFKDLNAIANASANPGKLIAYWVEK